MEIYAEDFFIYNFIMDLFVLCVCKKLLKTIGKPVSRKRFIISLFIAVLGSFLPFVFYDYGNLVAVGVFIVFSLVFSGFKNTFLSLFTVFTCFASFFGILTTIFNLFSPLSSPLFLILVLSVSGLICLTLLNIIYKIAHTVLNIKTKRKVVLENNGIRIIKTGFIDSGNLLTDRSGRPVCAVPKDVIYTLGPRVIDYIAVKTVGGISVLTEYRIDKLTVISGDEKLVKENVCLIANRSGQDMEIILNAAFA